MGWDVAFDNISIFFLPILGFQSRACYLINPVAADEKDNGWVSC